MRSHLCAPLFVLLALLVSGSCFETHHEHTAVHQTALWRRTSPDKMSERQKMQVVITADDQRVMNISTPLQNEKSEYIGAIGVGTNSEGSAQFEAHVVFDTGSTNLWVASTLCKDFPCNTDRAQRFYDTKLSLTEETFKGRRGEVDVSFGTGELRGPLHVDTYRVGPMVVKRQPFAMIREMHGEVFSSFPFEGILGLGFESMSVSDITPFFDRVIEQRLLTNNEFAFYLNDDSEKPSALLWGGIDKDLYHGPIAMFPVVQAHYWALELVDFRIGNASFQEVGMNGASVDRLIVDTGTTFFTAPSGLKDAIVNAIPAANCKNVSSYPPLTFVLRGSDSETYDLVVKPETYMLENKHGQHCRPAFMTMDVNPEYGPAMILGEVFMRHFFTVFSRGDGQPEHAKIGFAPAKLGAVPKVHVSQSASLVSIGGQKQKPIVRREDPHDIDHDNKIGRTVRHHSPLASPDATS